VLNAFEIPYRVLHDDDAGKPSEVALNARIAAALPATPGHLIHAVGPIDLEGLLGYVAPSRGKPFAAVKRVEELHAAGGLPPAFVVAMNMAYFGQAGEPAAD
jgi:hypothetical protein